MPQAVRNADQETRDHDPAVHFPRQWPRLHAPGPSSTLMRPVVGDRPLLSTRTGGDLSAGTRRATGEMGASCRDRRQGGHQDRDGRDQPVRAPVPDLRPAHLHGPAWHVQARGIAGVQRRTWRAPDHRRALDRGCIRLPRLPALGIQQPLHPGDRRWRVDDRVPDAARERLPALRQDDPIAIRP